MKKITATVYCVKCGHEESWHDAHGCFFVNAGPCKCRAFVAPETEKENVRVKKKKCYREIPRKSSLFSMKERPIAYITKQGSTRKEPFFGGGFC